MIACSLKPALTPIIIGDWGETLPCPSHGLNEKKVVGHTDGADQSSKGRGSFRQGGHKPALAEFMRCGVGESTDEILDDGGEWWFKKSMKARLIALFVALLLVGCGESPYDSTKSTESSKSIDLDDPEALDKIIAEAIEKDKLQLRGKEGEELHYALNEQTPYTGWVKTMWGDGQVKTLVQKKDGKKDGLATSWHKNRQKKFSVNFKDGKRVGLATGWYDNGQKGAEGNYKDGKEDGLWTEWYENGQKSSEWNFKDGKEDGLCTEWFDNGQKFVEENYKDGKLDGLMIGYNKDGTGGYRRTYKDGVRVED